MRFEYYEIWAYRLTSEEGGAEGQELIASSWDELTAWQERNPGQEPDFWTLFGRYRDEAADIYLAFAIADFPTFEQAMVVQDAILGVAIGARDILGDFSGVNEHVSRAYSMLEDCILQSSSEDRL